MIVLRVLGTLTLGTTGLTLLIVSTLPVASRRLPVVAVLALGGMIGALLYR